MLFTTAAPRLASAVNPDLLKIAQKQAKSRENWPHFWVKSRANSVFANLHSSAVNCHFRPIWDTLFRKANSVFANLRPNAVNCHLCGFCGQHSNRLNTPGFAHSSGINALHFTSYVTCKSPRISTGAQGCARWRGSLGYEKILGPHKPHPGIAGGYLILGPVSDVHRTDGVLGMDVQRLLNHHAARLSAIAGDCIRIFPIGFQSRLGVLIGDVRSQ